MLQKIIFEAILGPFVYKEDSKSLKSLHKL